MPKIEVELPDLTSDELRWYAEKTKRTREQAAADLIAERVRGVRDWLEQASRAFVRIPQGHAPEPSQTYPVNWSPSDDADFPDFSHIHEADPIEGSSIPLIGSDATFSEPREKVIRQVLTLIGDCWIGGKPVAQFYSLGRGTPTTITAEMALGFLDSIPYQGAQLPAPIAGASTQYLARGGVVPVSLQVFGNSIFSVLQGGAYTEGAPKEQAASLTRSFLEALFAFTPPELAAFFALDPGFSSYFCGTFWDIAFLVINAHEYWALLLCATDMD